MMIIVPVVGVMLPLLLMITATTVVGVMVRSGHHGAKTKNGQQ